MNNTHKFNENVKNYYDLTGDRYDGGIDLTVYVNNKKVYNDWSAGDHDWKYNNVYYNHIDLLLDKLAKENNLKSFESFTRFADC